MPSFRTLLPTALGAVLVCSACKSAPAPAPEDPPAQAAKPSAAKSYGAPLRAATVTSLASVLDGVDQFEGREVTVEGHVRRACSRKGCWMEVAQSADPKAPGCRVTFKDYGFFVPTDSAGDTAKVQGVVQTRTVPAARVQHLEEEGATFPHKYPGGTAKEITIVATGVELSKT